MKYQYDQSEITEHPCSLKGIEVLNEYGAEGWEVVQFDYRTAITVEGVWTGVWTLLLKRAMVAMLIVLGSILPAEALLFDSGSVSTSTSVDLAPGFYLYGAGGAVSGWPSQSQVYGPDLWSQTQPQRLERSSALRLVLRTKSRSNPNTEY